MHRNLRWWRKWFVLRCNQPRLRCGPITTQGDRILDRPLIEVGGKGLFIKELERSILSGESDAAVHSMKDMETHFAPNTEIGAVLAREDRRMRLLTVL